MINCWLVLCFQLSGQVSNQQVHELTSVEQHILWPVEPNSDSHNNKGQQSELSLIMFHVFIKQLLYVQAHGHLI